MTTSAAYSQQTTATSQTLPAVQLVLGLALLAAFSVPVLLASPGALTSDESLYVSEGMNLSLGKGFTYSTGELVSHRGPLFPALLAADFTVAGVSVEHARWVPRLFTLGNAVLMLLLGWRLFGRDAGLLAAASVLASALLTMIGVTLFLDGVETFFLLLMMLCTHQMFLEKKMRWAALTGASLGLAVLTKESALLWLPLPLLAMLLPGVTVERPRAMLVAYGLGFAAVAGWWWPYVYAVTGGVYLLGGLSGAAVWLGVFALGVGLPVAAVASRRGPSLGPGARWLVAAGVLVAWNVLFLIGLERNSGWPFPRDYIHQVPEYASTILAAWVKPLALIAVAWAYVAYRAARGSLGDRLLVLGFLLFLPFALFVANRGLNLRDILPVIYLSYLALGRSGISLARWVAAKIGEGFTPAAGGAVAALLVLGVFSWYAVPELRRFDDIQASFDSTVVRQSNWDNPLVTQTAAWVDEHVPPGTPVMSGRLYYSQLYVLTEGRYPWWQLPTVRVEFNDSPPALVRVTTMFRWEDYMMAEGPGEPWLYLRRYPIKGYYVALSERDLLADLREHEIGYLVVTGDDAGFSSLSLLPYFEEHPAFRKVTSFVEDARNQVHIFQVLASNLEATFPPARVSGETADALQAQLGEAGARSILSGLSPGGYLLTDSYGAPSSASSRAEGGP